MAKKSNILPFGPDRPLSWSAISSFQYSPEQWYDRYMLGIQEPPTEELKFGKEIGERIAADPTFLPKLPRHSIFEYKFLSEFAGTPLIGYADSYEPHTDLAEYKTGQKPWDQKRVDNHGQIDMYLFQMFLMHKVHPRDVKVQLAWMPTVKQGDFTIDFVRDDKGEPVIEVFETSRTMPQILAFGSVIKHALKDMELYANSRA